VGALVRQRNYILKGLTKWNIREIDLEVYTIQEFNSRMYTVFPIYLFWSTPYCLLYLPRNEYDINIHESFALKKFERWRLGRNSAASFFVTKCHESAAPDSILDISVSQRFADGKSTSLDNSPAAHSIVS
jgi:hypothetical protein